jgi:hypothetical protein
MRFIAMWRSLNDKRLTTFAFNLCKESSNALVIQVISETVSIIFPSWGCYLLAEMGLLTRGTGILSTKIVMMIANTKREQVMSLADKADHACS